VVTNLAILIAPSYGKAVSPETKRAAKDGYNTLCIVFSQPTEMQLPSMPKGAGWKTVDYRFTPPPQDPYAESVNEEVDLSGGPEDGT
jgi:hypothetical protein